MGMSKYLVILAALAVAVGAVFEIGDPTYDVNEPLESDDIIEAVNNAKTSWVAGRNFDPSLTKSYLKHLLGLRRKPSGSILPRYVDDGVDLEIPKSFDAREQWPNCQSLQTIRDQGPCGSCWAVSAVSTLNDRLYIASKGQFNSFLSAENLLSCCCCCAASCGQGCKGGYDDRAWEHLLLNGTCTGGGFKSKVGCQPYTLPTCEHHVPGTRKNCSAYGDVPTPKCKAKCYNKNYKDHTFQKDFHNVESAFTIMNETMLAQKEILRNGPLQAGFDVYDDFLSYKSGVYQHQAGGFIGGHAVKIIGWGTENGVDFWLVANSWNTDWGNNGIFKIKRGNNECGIELEINGGNPKRT